MKRERNSLMGAKLQALANVIYSSRLAAFVLADGRRISVKDGWDNASEQERAFLRTVHTSACKRFGTVLGPAYNAAHEDHLHVELGSGRFCR